MDKKTCGNCKHWDPESPSGGWPDGDGLCSAPVPLWVAESEASYGGVERLVYGEDEDAEKCSMWEG